jgi:DNA-binding transcriptional LysR family regulator
MEISQLRYFLAAAQTQNFRRAAELCTVAQSVLSRQIAALEVELGVLLFKRIAKRVVLSEAGEEFAGFARNALEQLQQGQQAMLQIKSGERGSIMIGCIEALATSYLPSIISRFHSSHPYVHLSVSVGGADTLMTQLEHGTLDIVLTLNPIIRPEMLVVHELFRQPLHLITSLHHPFALAKLPRVSLVEVAKEPLVLFREGFGLRRIMDTIFNQRGYVLESIVEIDSIEGMKELVKQDVGVTLMPLVLVRPAQIDIELAVFPLADFSDEFIFAVVYRRFSLLSPAALALIGLMR